MYGIGDYENMKMSRYNWNIVESGVKHHKNIIQLEAQVSLYRSPDINKSS